MNKSKKAAYASLDLGVIGTRALLIKPICLFREKVQEKDRIEDSNVKVLRKTANHL